MSCGAKRIAKMPRLDNPKHEAYALNLAKGMKQVDAYSHAGYNSNPSAASRLATAPMIADRIDELKVELRQNMSKALTRPIDEMSGTLEEMGLTIEWVATQYAHIYEEAIKDCSFAAANSAVNSIQKLIEAGADGGGAEEKQVSPTIKINEVTDMLVAVKALAQLGQEKGSSDLRDITPLSPQQILATQTGPENADNES